MRLPWLSWTPLWGTGAAELAEQRRIFEVTVAVPREDGGEEAHARVEALRGDAEERRLKRRRTLPGWPPGGVETYTVALVTDAAEMDLAKPELTGGGPTGYVVLRVDEGENFSPNRGNDPRIPIEEQRFLCRPPTAGEREALDKGFAVLGIGTSLRVERG